MSEERLQAHISTTHSQQPKLHCPLCQESFTEKSRIEKHLIQVHNVTHEGLQRLLTMVDTSEWAASQAAGTPPGGQGQVTQNQTSSSTAVPPKASTPNRSGAATPASEGESDSKSDIMGDLDAIRIGDDGTKLPSFTFHNYKIIIKAKLFRVNADSIFFLNTMTTLHYSK